MAYPDNDVQVIEARRCAITLLKTLAVSKDFQHTHAAVYAFVASMDCRAHILGDGDFLEIYQASLLRRGKTKARQPKARAAKAGQ